METPQHTAGRGEDHGAVAHPQTPFSGQCLSGRRVRSWRSWRRAGGPELVRPMTVHWRQGRSTVRPLRL